MFKRIVLLTLLIPTMVMAVPLDSVVAVVNEGVITSSELDTQVDLMRKQIAGRGMQLPPDNVLRKQVLQHLIDVDLQLQLAKQNSLTIDDAELNDAINRIATSNHLAIPELQKAIEQQGIGWSEYRDNIRKEIIISRVQQKAVGKDITVSPQQIDDYLKAPEHQENTDLTYHLQNIVIPLPEEPTTKELQKAKAKADALLDKIGQGADFNQLAIAESSGEFALEGGDLGERHLAELPEIFAAQVAVMKQGDVAGPIRAGNGFQLIKLVGFGGDNARHEVTKTHVRHILLKQDASMTVEEAQKQADNLYQQLKSGKDFATLAKHYSLDVSSAVKGGDLGWVTGGELVPSFEQAMNELAVMEISKPVKSPFGWHLIQVLERKKIDDTASFKRDQVRQFLQQRKFTESVQNWLQHVRADAYIKVVDKGLA